MCPSPLQSPSEEKLELVLLEKKKESLAAGLWLPTSPLTASSLLSPQNPASDLSVQPSRSTSPSLWIVELFWSVPEKRPAGVRQALCLQALHMIAVMIETLKAGLEGTFWTFCFPSHKTAFLVDIFFG